MAFVVTLVCNLHCVTLGFGSFRLRLVIPDFGETD